MSGYFARRFWACVVGMGLLTFVGGAQAGGTATCGDGTCDTDETADNCPSDCGCAATSCGGPAPGGCWCDCECVDEGDCCPDADLLCDVFSCSDDSCEGDCGGQAGSGCYCDCLCVGFGDCCADAEQFCSLSTTCIGACCFEENDNIAGFNGTCEEISETECSDRGGSYQGDFSSCAAGACDPRGACCLSNLGSNVAGGKGPGNCIETSEIDCLKGFGGEFLGVGTFCEPGLCNPERVDISQKGSLLIFSDVELEFTQSPIAGPIGWHVAKDTIISLTNDYPGEVYVQMYFVNGDPQRDAVFTSGPAPILVSEAEPGWNWVDCAVLLTPDQSVYWSAASGNPVGCQPFGILDPDLGNGPGRPNPEVLGGPRVLRGLVVAWAVNADGQQINWNHLSGKATIVDYAAQAAWEYSPWAFQSHIGETGTILPASGLLAMDGFMYDNAFDMLLFDFFAAGSAALSSDGNAVSVDTDLTLHPIDADLRQETEGPVTTKAHFDIWNMNERKLSNTRRCITCWDQVLLSQFGAPNNFLLVNLQSDKGKARINGLQADECDVNCFRDMEPPPPPADGGNQTAGFLGDLLDLEFICSDDAAILGVAAKILRFGDNSIDYAGSELVGMGIESAFIVYDVVGPPGTLREDAYNRIRPVQSKPTRIEGNSRGK